MSLDEVYTDLKIIQTHKKEDVSLCSYKELFQSEGMKNRTIVVKGEAGVGKSTWCMQLVQAWVKVHEPPDGNSNISPSKSASHVNGIADLEEAMSTFDFLFFVQLRYVEGILSIKDMIFSSSIERLSPFQATVRHIIEKYSEKVLIILDGLDEYSLDLSYMGLNSCTVISTTRPWKFDRICSRNTKVDIVLKISGLDANGVVELSEKFFKVLNYQMSTLNDDKPNVNASITNVDNFMENVRRIGMSDSVRTPLILLIMLETYLEKGYLSSSRTCNLLCLVECLVIRGEQKLSEEEMTKLEKMKECWAKSEKTFKISDKNETLSEYSGLLQKLSSLAYGGMNRSDKKYTLVFNEKELCHYFSQEELQICLRFGLLSKSKQFTSFLTRMRVSISFYHKLLQEYLAALWIINSSERFVQFMSNINNIQDIIEMENMIYFIYGTDSHLGSKLTKHMVELFNRDPIILEQRQHIDGDVMLPWELHQMSCVLLQCQEEVCSSGQFHEAVYTTDISVFSITGSSAIDSVLKLMRQSEHCLKSLFAQCVQFQFTQCQELFEIISKSLTLETLVIIMPTFLAAVHSREGLICLELDFSRHHAFKNCYLVGRGQSTASGLLPLVRNLESALNLVNLRLRNIGSECCNIFSNIILDLENLESVFMDNMEFTEGNLLIQNTKLQTLHMRNVTLKNYSVVLNNVYELLEVSIKFMEMQGAGWKDLFDKLKYQPKLRKLLIRNVNCVDGTLDLEQSIHLEYLRLYDFSVSDIRITKCKQLKVVDLRKIYFTSSPAYPESSTSSAELTYWQAVLTRDRNVGVPYSNVKRKSLDSDTHTHDVTERECDLAGIQESSFYYSDWERRFLESLPTDSLEEVMLYNLHIGNANIALENCRHLNFISLYHLTMSEESFTRLVSTLAGLRSLPELDIKELNVSGLMREITIKDLKSRGTESAEQSST